MTRQLKMELESNNVDAIGPCLKQGWEIKKSLASGITSPLIDNAYELGMSAGASGGKLLGAGGGGFLLFYVPDEAKRKAVRQALHDFKEMPFELDQSGVSIVYTE